MDNDSIQLDPALYSGATIKFIYRRLSDGHAYNTTGGGSFEAWDDAHWSQYQVSTSQQGTSGFFAATRPSVVVAAGPASISVVKRVDGTKANDVIVGGGDDDVIDQSALLTTEHFDETMAADNPVGPGADQCTLNFTSGSTPIADARVWVSTDLAGTNVIAGTKQTDSGGDVTFLLDAGTTYYAWMHKDGFNDVQGQEFVAVAD